MENLKYNLFPSAWKSNTHLTPSVLQKVHIHLGFSKRWTFDFQESWHLLCYGTFSKYLSLIYRGGIQLAENVSIFYWAEDMLKKGMLKDFTLPVSISESGF